MNITYPWYRFGLNAWSLSMQASSAIVLRMLRIGSGDREGDAKAGQMVVGEAQVAFGPRNGEAEAVRMISEASETILPKPKPLPKPRRKQYLAASLAQRKKARGDRPPAARRRH